MDLFFRRFLPGLMLTALLGGCAPLFPSPEEDVVPSPTPPTSKPAASTPGVADPSPAPSASTAIPLSSLPVSEILRLPARFLPEALEGRSVTLDAPTPLPFAVLAQRLADAAKTTVRLEDKAPRDGQAVALPEPPRLTGHWQGRLRAVLDEVATAGGYEWRWDKESKQIVLMRWRDGQGAQTARRQGSTPLRHWAVVPTRHKTLKGVITAWARSAGWHVVWEADTPDYAVTTEALFEGGFAEAVGDLLLATASTERPIVPVAYPLNRQIVITVQK